MHALFALWAATTHRATTLCPLWKIQNHREQSTPGSQLSAAPQFHNALPSHRSARGVGGRGRGHVTANCTSQHHHPYHPSKPAHKLLRGGTPPLDVTIEGRGRCAPNPNYQSPPHSAFSARAILEFAHLAVSLSCSRSNRESKAAPRLSRRIYHSRPPRLGPY